MKLANKSYVLSSLYNLDDFSCTGEIAQTQVNALCVKCNKNIRISKFSRFPSPKSKKLYKTPDSSWISVIITKPAQFYNHSMHVYSGYITVWVSKLDRQLRFNKNITIQGLKQKISAFNRLNHTSIELRLPFKWTKIRAMTELSMYFFTPKYYRR